METLARASQSPITSHLLLASGLLNVLHDAVTRLCNTLLALHGRIPRNDANDGMALSLDCLSDVLSFMAVCAEEPIIKTWCGESGREFWKPLMLVLGSGILFSPVSRTNRQTPPLPTRHRIALESAVINYFSQCMACYPDNQSSFARLMCEVMETPCEIISATGQCVLGNIKGVGLDGFLRRLVLEALLRDERVKVCIHYGSVFKPFLASQEDNFRHNKDWHPRFGAGYDTLLFKAKLSSTIEELDEIVLPNISTKKSTEGSGSEEDKPGTYGDFDDLAALGDSEILEGLSIAAGINVKSKRAKTGTVLRKMSSQKLDASLLRPGPASTVCRHHVLLGNMLIQSKTNLSSLLSVLMSRGLAAGTNCIELSLKTCGNPSSHVTDDTLLDTPPMATALHKFASSNGLAILSSRLSCPVVMNQPTQEAAMTDPDQVPLPLAFPLPLFSLSPTVLSRIPGHSLAAFGLFISLPGYANVLLRDRPKAQCLLRLLLGAEDDGNGGES
jgi:baculoviral IAP repeat-containing protein 6